MPNPILVIASVVPYLLADVGPVPGTQAVAPVFEKADIVCNCFVQSVKVAEQPVGTSGTDTICHRATAEVQIRDLYKTDGSSNRTITVVFEVTEQNGRPVVGSERLSSGETGILFLKKDNNGVYSFADPFLGVTPISSLPQQTGEPGLSKLRSVLSDVAMGSQEVDTLRALRLLQGFDTFDEGSLSKVKSLSYSEQPEIAVTALGIMLKAKMPESLERLKTYLQKYRGDAATLAVAAIGRELAQMTDPDDLPAIEELSSSRYLSIQLGAMDAIRRMRNVQSIPALIKRLDEPDNTVEYIAVITLAEILSKFEGDYAPTMNLFDERPQYYTALWKQWWAYEGSKLYPPRTASAAN